MRKLILLAVLAAAVPSFAQNPQKGDWDLGIYATGGTSVPGGTKDTQVFSLGLRAGKVLTGDHLPGFLRGNFEYAFDVVPAYIVFQNQNTYGAGFDPVVLKWNFTSSKRVTPFFEIVGGTLFSTNEVPPGTSSVNFRSGAGFGMHFPISSGRRTLTVEAKYEHISNAGLATPNPGINTVQFVLGWGMFKHRK
jgi:lipid A 3-O-deacylase